MYIGRIMHTDLVTVSPETSLVDARDTLEKKNIEHLLVVNEKGKLVGLVSDRDLKQHWASPATSLSTHELNYLLQKVLVKMIMVKTVVTVPVDTTIERAAFVMQQHNISSLPVMENDDLVGIITSTDVMSVLLDAIGISDDSMRLGVFVKDSIGVMAQVAAILKDEKINIQSLLTWPEKKHPGISQLVMRVASQDGIKAINALQEKGFKVKSGYAKDITPYLP
ncbi:CBS and ACT domain-containing protein [Desulfosediminicola flagellatus]|uniref:CBS and ACT domain-containing protein n=1 Tax=Desulfosediminicola flagellatus TaxID=2569541 RepID=UPI0010ABAEB0|nr:CBS and ACT domain-containing protein [Desulfosediminicola flagellatus]